MITGLNLINMVYENYYRCPATRPGTYLTSISTSSPGCLSALIYLYLILLALYVLTSPSSLIILPIVLTGTIMFCFFNLQCSFLAHSFVSFLNSITLSLTRIGVSLGLVFGIVAFDSRPPSPFSRYNLHHLSKLLLLCGHIFAASTSFTYLLIIRRIHLNLSSLIVFAIFIAISTF